VAFIGVPSLGLAAIPVVQEEKLPEITVAAARRPSFASYA